jgi:puromycin-sensitive aminopeptidase
MNPKAYRLPRHALPKRYDVRIDARLSSEDFDGSVRIELDLAQPSDVIELHARDLQIPRVELSANGQTFSGTVELDAEREIALIRLPEAVAAGCAVLDLDFKGRLSEGLQGLYRAVNGPEQVLCTQCEATDARAIFPCFDEPTFKARFAWEVTTSPDVTALANGPLVSATQSDDGQSKTWTFAPTKPMSSYLVALVIGDIAGTEEQNVDGTPIRVWSMQDKERLGDFAHRYTARLLPWYEEYFGAPYHYDKYDQVAVPGFAAGAMENSGLVLFRQNLLLMDPKTASWNQEKVIALVVAHEFAHMWFGNLVTMQWWDDLWLNEAFAEWVCHKAVNNLSPDYAVWDDFQVDKNQALNIDALESTHPIYNMVETPEEAGEMFDVITYQKGCSVLRMLESFLGETDFRAGIRNYMREFAERNTVRGDLWRSLQDASEAPVTDIMENWIMQPGYPCLEVGLVEAPDGAGLRIKQERFYSNPTPAQRSSQTWQVPVLVRYEDQAGVHETRHLLKERETTLPLDVQGELTWLYANAGAIGYYRQSFEPALLERILANVARLTPAEQTALLDDQWALTRSGGQSMVKFLDVLAAMATVDNYLVLRGVVARLHTVEEMLEEAGDTAALDRFRAWVDGALRTKLQQLGFEPHADEAPNQSQQRVSVVDAMTSLAHNSEAIAEATRWAEREEADPAAVDPNLAQIVIDAAAANGDAARFERYVQVYQRRRESGAAPQETNRYLQSLVRFRNPELVQQTLDLVDEKVIPQEAIIQTLGRMLNLRYAQLPAWQYLKDHWASLAGLSDLAVNVLVEQAGKLPAAMRGEVVQFFDANLNGRAPMSYARALETMDQRAEFQSQT